MKKMLIIFSILALIITSSLFIGTYALFETDADLGRLSGTVQWIWNTTLRPGHKRRNWFIDQFI